VARATAHTLPSAGNECKHSSACEQTTDGARTPERAGLAFHVRGRARPEQHRQRLATADLPGLDVALDLARAARLSHACPRQLPRHACWLERCTGGTRAPAGSAVEDAHGPQQGLQALLNPTDVHTASQLHVRPVTATARASCAGKRSSRTEQARLQGRRVQRVRGRAEDVDQRAPRQPQARDQAPLRLLAPPAALSAARANQDAAGVTAPHSHCPFSCCLLLTLAAYC